MCWSSGTKRDRGWFSVFPTDNLQLASKVETNGSQRGWAVATKMQALHCVAVVVPIAMAATGNWNPCQPTSRTNQPRRCWNFLSLTCNFWTPWGFRAYPGLTVVWGMFRSIYNWCLSLLKMWMWHAASTARPDTWRLPSASAKAVVLGPQFLGSRAWETTCSGSLGS
jgi:hypothetical protein